MKRAIRLLLALSATLAALALAGPAGAANAKLFGVVGPGFNISLRDANGTRVTNLDPGTYDITIEDASDEHNFHLRGPGVNRFTEIEFVGTVTWTVTLVEGRYTYLCDPHGTTMLGRFTVGNPPPVTQPTPKLTGTVGPGMSISLRNAAGVLVRGLKAGLYAITVRDRSSAHNFHLTGPGVNKRTGVAFKGSVTWKVRFQPGKTYRFLCDPHARTLRGSFKSR